MEINSLIDKLKNDQDTSDIERSNYALYIASVDDKLQVINDKVEKLDSKIDDKINKIVWFKWNKALIVVFALLVLILIFNQPEKSESVKKIYVVNPAPIVSQDIPINTNINKVERKLRANEAFYYGGQIKSVCGKVVEISDLKSGIFLNIDKRFPATEFSGIIWKKGNKISLNFINSLLHKDICIKGKIRLYKGKASVTIRNEDMISKHSL